MNNMKTMNIGLLIVGIFLLPAMIASAELQSGKPLFLWGVLLTVSVAANIRAAYRITQNVTFDDLSRGTTAQARTLWVKRKYVHATAAYLSAPLILVGVIAIGVCLVGMALL